MFRADISFFCLLNRWLSYSARTTWSWTLSRCQRSRDSYSRNYSARKRKPWKTKQRHRKTRQRLSTLKSSNLREIILTRKPRIQTRRRRSSDGMDRVKGWPKRATVDLYSSSQKSWSSYLVQAMVSFIFTTMCFIKDFVGKWISSEPTLLVEYSLFLLLQNRKVKNANVVNCRQEC